MNFFLKVGAFKNNALVSEIRGPYSKEDLWKMVQGGFIGNETLTSQNSNSEDWMPIGNVDEFQIDYAKFDIKIVWIFGFIMAALSLLFGAFNLHQPGLIYQLLGLFIHVGILVGLSIGIHEKSRACAVLMLSYFCLNLFFALLKIQSNPGAAIAYGASGLLWGFFFWRGIQGTFNYHRIVSGTKSRS